MDRIRTYLQALEANLRAGDATEHTHRPALQALLESIAPGIRAVNEPRRVECGAPDFRVSREPGPVTVGYVETKDVGESLDEAERSDQLQRYLRSLPNLILTDYLEFRWYVDGEFRGSAQVARVGPGGKLLRNKHGARALPDLLKDFVSHRPAPIATPRELAERMARLTYLIRDVVVEAFALDMASPLLRDLRHAFAVTLLPDLDDPQKTGEFADMYAQTLAYGLFSARAMDTAKGFTRQDAQNLIPKTNPFLRRFFYEITGPDMDEEPHAGFVDDLAHLLENADMSAILADFGRRTRQEDPVVHFYETFLAAYDPQLRETRGVYYTPEPVVSYIVRSVDALLKSRFGCPWGLAEMQKDVYILDPATGTATFLYFVIQRIHDALRELGQGGLWPGYVEDNLLDRVFGFELLMAPYTVAHMKLSVLLRELGYQPSGKKRLGIYLTNTLEEAGQRVDNLFGWRMIGDEAKEAAAIKRDKPIMVVLGNPPYSGISANKGAWIEGLLKGKLPNGDVVPSYYEVDGKPLGEKKLWLQDDYVKFIRWGQWRIEQTGAGVLAFITNHGYLDNPTFRGMRQQLMRAFTDIYILDLHGNVKKRETAPDGSKDENVFDIQQGVAIGIFVKERGKSGPARVHHADLWGLRDGKYRALFEMDVATTLWRELSPRSPFYLFVPRNVDLEGEYQQGWKVTEIFPVSVTGIVTARDHFVFDYDKVALLRRIREFADPTLSDDQIRFRYFAGKGSDKYPDGDTRGWKLPEARQRVRNDPDWDKRIVPCLYRPFDVRFLYYADWMVDWPRPEVMRHMLAGKNLGLIFMRQVALNEEYTHFGVTRTLIDNRAFYSNKGIMSLAPLYLYTETKQEKPLRGGGKVVMMALLEPGAGYATRHANLSPEFVAAFAEKLSMEYVPDGRGDLRATFGPEDVFHYIYAVFHSPTYRDRYAEFLKTDFPRVPLTSDAALFRALAAKGEELVALHLMESPALDALITCFPVEGDNEVTKVQYQEPSDDAPGRVHINKTQYFEGVPPEVWEFQVGGYQVCEKWLKDRKGRRLTGQDVLHYQRMVVALRETIRLMGEIDEAIPDWPLP